MFKRRLHFGLVVFVSAAVLSCGESKPAPPAAKNDDVNDPPKVVIAQPAATEIDTFEKRKAWYLDTVRRTPIPAGFFEVQPDGGIKFSEMRPDPGKHLWHWIQAELAKDPSGEQVLVHRGVTVKQLIKALVRYPNMFHFNADGPAMCLYRWPHLIEPADRDYLFQGHDRSILDHSDQPNYNLFTCEGTENHLALSRFSGYLLCQNWLEDHPDDERAKQGLAQCRAYILKRMRRVLEVGTGEFNSTTYYGYQMRGMMLCYEFAKDEEVRDACRALLDYFATEICLNYFNGINAAPESRGGATRACEKECDQVVWLWFGDSPIAPTKPTNLVYAALSSYRPPAALEAVAKKLAPQQQFYFKTQPSYLLDRPAFSCETMCFDRSFAISCMYMPRAGYTGASVQYRPSKVVSRAGTDGPTWVMFANDNSITETGGGRGPYTQWASHVGVLVQITHVPANADALKEKAAAITNQWQAKWLASFKQRWNLASTDRRVATPIDNLKTGDVVSYLVFRGDESSGLQLAMEEESGIVFMKHNDTHIAVRTLSGRMPKLAEKRDAKLAKKDASWRWLVDPVDEDGLAGFVVEASDGEGQSFEAFQEAVRTGSRVKTVTGERRVVYHSLSGATINVQHQSKATRPQIEAIFDWGYIEDEALNKPMAIPTVPPFNQPTYPAAGDDLEGWGRVPIARYEDVRFTPELPMGSTSVDVISGELVQMGGGELRIRRLVRNDATGAESLKTVYVLSLDAQGRPRWSGE